MAMIDPLPGDIFRKGQVLNNTYEIEGVLGRGGTGEAYRARNQITGRVVAVKALNREFSQQRRLPRADEARGGDAQHPPRRGRALHRLQPDGGGARLPRHGLCGRDAARRLARPERRAARPPRHRAPGGGGAGGDPRPADRPPRPLARQHHPARRRPRRGGDHRLRHRQGRERRGAHDRRQRLRGQVRVRRPGADGRAGRAAVGPLCARGVASRGVPRAGAGHGRQPGRGAAAQGVSRSTRGACRSRSRG